MENNSSKRFLLSAVWFLFTAVAVFITSQFWNNPIPMIGKENELLEILFPLFIVFFSPALLFAAITSLTGKNIAITSLAMLVLHITAFFILGATMFKGEDVIGLIFAYFIIGVAFLCSAILGVSLRKLFARHESILKWLFVIPFFLSVGLAVRVYMYQTPTALSCGDLNIQGQMYCYDKFARQQNNPIWCYAIRAADNIKDDCVQAIMAINNNPIDPLQCKILPDSRSKLDCTVSASTQNGDISICEKQALASTDKCLVDIIYINYRTNRTTDCSVLTNPDNKKMCYYVLSLNPGL